MSVRLAAIVASIGLGLASCKGMGGFASGLGHAASGLGHVASGLGHVAGSVAVAAAKAAPAIARATPLVARAAGQALPVALRVTETVAEAVMLASDTSGEDFEATSDESAPALGEDNVPGAPGAYDPCLSCPDAMPCEACMGWNNNACRDTPGGASMRCESE
jgi:hypothetical protein